MPRATIRASRKRPRKTKGTTPSGNYKWRILSVVVFGLFMVVLDSTVVNVAFPTLRAEFHESLARAQWIVSVYMLALGVTTPIAGFLADRFGAKRIYLAGIGVFVIGSVCSGFAPNIFVLIATRALQAIGGGLALPVGAAMLYKAFPPEEVGRALGFFGLAVLTAPGVGPLVGGVLVDHGLWRWIFFINLPIGIVAIVLGTFMLKADSHKAKSNPDWWGLLLSAIGFGAVLHASSIASVDGWSAPTTLIWFAVGGIGLVLFTVVELRSKEVEPLLDLRLYLEPVFLNANFVGYIAVIALFGAEFLLPIYLQQLRHMSGFTTGVTLLPLAITASITAPLAGNLYDRIGPRSIAVFGYAILAFNTYQLAGITMTTSRTYIMFLMALRGVALGCTVQTTNTTALGSIARAKLQRGSALVQGTRFVVQSIGVALLATVLASASSSQQPTLAGFDAAYTVTFYASLGALVLALLLPGWPAAWSGRMSLRG